MTFYIHYICDFFSCDFFSCDFFSCDFSSMTFFPWLSCLHSVILFTGAWGMDFVSSSPFSLLPPFSKFSYKSFLFQNFHNHWFFFHLTISVDVIHHEEYVYSVSTVFRLIHICAALYVLFANILSFVVSLLLHP